MSRPIPWLALAAGVVGIGAAAMQERRGSAAHRSYAGDPYWMTAKYPGTDAKGLAFKKGERVFYYPRTKTIYAGKNAEAAAQDFRSMAEDEDFLGGGSYNTGSAARGGDDRAYREAYNRAVDMANRLNREVGLRKDAFGGYMVYLFTEAERYSHRGQVVRPGEPKMNLGRS